MCDVSGDASGQPEHTLVLCFLGEVCYGQPNYLTVDFDLMLVVMATMAGAAGCFCSSLC